MSSVSCVYNEGGVIATNPQLNKCLVVKCRASLLSVRLIQSSINHLKTALILTAVQFVQKPLLTSQDLVTVQHWFSIHIPFHEILLVWISSLSLILTKGI